MATHSSVLAWRIPGTGEPSGLPSVGSHRVGHDWRDLAAAAAAAAWCHMIIFKGSLIYMLDFWEQHSDWFQIGKGVCQGSILLPCLFNLYAEYIMRNAGLEESTLYYESTLIIPCKATAAAKSLQSCPTLCDPTNGSQPGSSVAGTLQARILE